MDRQLLVIALLGVGGCLAGAGPTAGVRTTGEFSWGWEASGSVMGSLQRGGGGAMIGQSIPWGPRRSTVYFAAQGYRSLQDDPVHDSGSYLGASGGLAVREGGVQPHGGLWGMALSGKLSCAGDPEGGSVLTVQLGVRWIAGAGELYLAPKVNSFGDYCLN